MALNGRYIRHDLSTAKELLAAAAYPNGMAVQLLSTTSYADVLVQAVELCQQDLAAVSIQAPIKMQDYSEFVTSTFQGRFEGGNRVVFGPIAPPPEPCSHLFNVYHPRGPRNSAGVNDPKLTTMIEQLPQALDGKARRQQTFRHPTLSRPRGLLRAARGWHDDGGSEFQTSRFLSVFEFGLRRRSCAQGVARPRDRGKVHIGC